MDCQIFDGTESDSIISTPFTLSLEQENASTFYGIHSIKNNDSDEEYEEECKSPKNNKKENEKKELVPTIFQWKEDNCELVYLSGSFVNWKQLLLMTKNENGIYSITLPLPKGIYQYKFKINEEWKINNDFPVMNDNQGNQNNFIDTTQQKSRSEENKKSIKTTSLETAYDSSPQKTDQKENCLNSKIRGFELETDSEHIKINSEENEYEEEENSEESSNDSLELEEQIEDNSESENDIIYRKNDNIKYKLKEIKYSLKYPKKKHCYNIPPDMPDQFDYSFDLDLFGNQSEIGKKKYFEPKENNIYSGDYTFKSITLFPKVEINHIHSKNIKMLDKITLCSSYKRYRHKFTTFLYYTPVV